MKHEFFGNNNEDKHTKNQATKPTQKTEVGQYFYKGKESDLIVFVKSEDAVEHYLEEPRVEALSDCVETFQIFTNHGSRGNEGVLGEASKAVVEGELGKGKDQYAAIDMILREGKYTGQMSQVRRKDRMRA